MTLDDVNAMKIEDFVDAFGAIYEHSPWIAEAAAQKRPFTSLEAMLGGFAEVVVSATEEQRLALINAHPELAGKAVLDRTLTDASAAEQASAGLDRMSQAEFDTFHSLNAAYRERFDFPFIICVRLTNKAGILEAMRTRLLHNRAMEFAVALVEINKIARLRLKEKVA